MKLLLALALALAGRMAVCVGAEAPSPSIDPLQSRIREIETAVADICARADRGQLAETARIRLPAIGDRIPAVNLSFSPNTLDRDLDAAVTAIDQLERRLVDAQKQARTPAPPTPDNRPLTVEERLRRAESGLPQNQGPVRDPAFDLFGAYDETRRERNTRRDAQAEADMARVAEERSQAEALRTARAEAAQQIQDQNRQWQEELDNQAVKHAEAEAQWKREHSAGAFVRNALRTVVGGAVSSFGSGFASSVGAGLADKVIRDKYPDFKPRGKYDKDTDK